MRRVKWDNPIDPIHAQKLAVRLLEHACGGSAGRGEQDPIYREVTEKRDWGAGYSSCGDLAHWLLYRLGVRLPLINRGEHQGWRVGRNVSDLAWSDWSTGVGDGTEFSPGDIVIVWNRRDGTDAHVACVIDEPIGEGVLLTADYGQPGGALRTRGLTVRDDGKIYLGERQIQRRVPLLAVLRAAQEAGLLEDAEDPTPEPEDTTHA